MSPISLTVAQLLPYQIQLGYKQIISPWHLVEGSSRKEERLTLQEVPRAAWNWNCSYKEMMAAVVSDEHTFIYLYPPSSCPPPSSTFKSAHHLVYLQQYRSRRQSSPTNERHNLLCLLNPSRLLNIFRYHPRSLFLKSATAKKTCLRQ